MKHFTTVTTVMRGTINPSQCRNIHVNTQLCSGFAYVLVNTQLCSGFAYILGFVCILIRQTLIAGYITYIMHIIYHISLINTVSMISSPVRYYLNTNKIDIVVFLVVYPQIVPHATMRLWVLQQIIV